MTVINYAARILVILVGMAILGGISPFKGLSSPLHEIFGIVVILFGTLRLVMYILARRRSNDDDEE
ncbi:MAG: hypothetical protein J0I17_07750 ['Candidatus Kapabacteria' thiocyanatum]|uniref:Uncharacterized protein n=1 Tax=Candidatus Kapaibacterium thiocyanatum TaxID=1895771 RepID=A0A1M3L284_9BACT|nr:hypothetical protein ['Candidatus Kapabacteria' thiocyanatum]OJX59332.1 MAG: hypothetical protein BGO89_02630 ['Candidatus Kapabacteria' thiocyanatum]